MIKCELCGATENLQKHHIVPEVRGGKKNSSNMVVLCKMCHSKLHGRPVGGRVIKSTWVPTRTPSHLAGQNIYRDLVPLVKKVVAKGDYPTIVSLVSYAVKHFLDEKYPEMMKTFKANWQDIYGKPRGEEVRRELCGPGRTEFGAQRNSASHIKFGTQTANASQLTNGTQGKFAEVRDPLRPCGRRAAGSNSFTFGPPPRARKSEGGGDQAPGIDLNTNNNTNNMVGCLKLNAITAVTNGTTKAD